MIDDRLHNDCDGGFCCSCVQVETPEEAPRFRNPGEALGHLNRERVRNWYRDHIGTTQAECARRLGISAMAVSRHVRALRQEWMDAE